MKANMKLIILAVAPLLCAALWMDRQPVYKPYRSPVLVPPVGSVPVSGRETVSEESEPKNPLQAIPGELTGGKALFAINCAMCHGIAQDKPGPVGNKLSPPPPVLDHQLVRERSDSHIYKAITFGFGRMPPFKGKLTATERWQLVNYLRSRK